MRDQLTTAMKEAMRAKDTKALGTLRLIIAALKDRDIAARSKGLTEGIDETEILQMLQTMVKQRRESINMYEKGGRLELAEGEQNEITVIERFLPQQLDEAATNEAVAKLVEELGANSLKDMGGVMSALRERYAGQMDFSKASAAVKQKLA